MSMSTRWKKIVARLSRLSVFRRLVSVAAKIISTAKAAYAEFWAVTLTGPSKYPAFDIATNHFHPMAKFGHAQNVSPRVFADEEVVGLVRLLRLLESQAVPAA